jgi:hypothetical protein
VSDKTEDIALGYVTITGRQPVFVRKSKPPIEDREVAMEEAYERAVNCARFERTGQTRVPSAPGKPAPTIGPGTPPRRRALVDLSPASVFKAPSSEARSGGRLEMTGPSQQRSDKAKL